MKLENKDDKDGNRVLHVDLEGIRYLQQGLETLEESPVGTQLSTPSFWEERSAPWWRFWDRKKTMMSAEFILQREPEDDEG